jgi:hypothetical protein
MVRTTLNRLYDLTQIRHLAIARMSFFVIISSGGRADGGYLNLCYGEPLFAKNPSLGEGNGPRPGTKECRYVLVSLGDGDEADELGTCISKLFLRFLKIKCHD